MGLAPFIASKLLRAATSVGANLEEAAAAQSRADFINKCSISAKEARETLYWLRLVREAFPKLTEFGALVGEADQIVAILTTIVKKSRARAGDRH